MLWHRFQTDGTCESGNRIRRLHILDNRVSKVPPLGVLPCTVQTQYQYPPGPGRSATGTFRPNPHYLPGPCGLNPRRGGIPSRPRSESSLPNKPWTATPPTRRQPSPCMTCAGTRLGVCQQCALGRDAWVGSRLWGPSNIPRRTAACLQGSRSHRVGRSGRLPLLYPRARRLLAIPTHPVGHNGPSRFGKGCALMDSMT